VALHGPKRSHMGGDSHPASGPASSQQDAVARERMVAAAAAAEGGEGPGERAGGGDGVGGGGGAGDRAEGGQGLLWPLSAKSGMMFLPRSQSSKDHGRDSREYGKRGGREGEGAARHAQALAAERVHGGKRGFQGEAW